MSPSCKNHELFVHEEWNPRCQRRVLLGFLNLLTPLIFIFLVNAKRKENISKPNIKLCQQFHFLFKRKPIIPEYSFSKCGPQTLSGPQALTGVLLSSSTYYLPFSHTSVQWSFPEATDK